MKKLLLLFLTMFIGAGISFSQTTLVGWDFNFSGANTSGIPANSGTTISSSPGPIFSSVGCSGGEMIVNSMGPGNSMVSTSFSTLGYTSVNYSFTHSEFSVARNFSFQYSLNGSTWINVVASYSPPINVGCSPWYTASNVAMPAAVDNKATVYLRWLCNSGSGAGGTRLDEVVIKGTASCTAPTIPTITSAPGTICDGNSALLTISGTKNDATAWHVYSGSCGGTSVGTTTGSTVIVTPTPPGTTYYVRGEGGCVSPGSCGSILVSTTARENATFNYSTSAYCVDDSDPTPTITGVGGGSFTSSPGGLSINSSTGAIDVSVSTPNTYTVTYTTSGLCAGDEDVSVTINALDDASFSYADPSYCQNDSDPTPTITGLGSGSFSAGAGLSINASNGAVDLSASTPGTYTVTYTTSGTCPNSSNITLTVNALDNAAFSYSAASYCSNDSDPTPTITGLGGGGFTSAPGGLTINTGTGAIDVSTSTPGSYTVTYTTTGTCPAGSNNNVEIFGAGAASPPVSNTYNINTATNPAVGGVCGANSGIDASFDCAFDGSGAISLGDFTDLSPIGSEINSLDLVIYGACSGDVEFFLNGTSITTGVATGLSCSCQSIAGDPNIPQSYSVTINPTIQAAFIANGVNTLSVAVNNSSSGAQCFYGADVLLVTQGANILDAPADLCIDAGVQTGEGNTIPTGGIYSGNGVTDDGNGTTYSFDPATAGIGVHSITYNYTNANGCASNASDNVEVFALPSVTFTALADLCANSGVQTGLGNGLPSGAGGVYSGPGVTDDGNGNTYSFDPAAAGAGVHTITYNYSDGNGCSGIANDNVEVFALPTATYTALSDLCIDAGVQTSLTGGSASGGVYSGPGVTDAGNGTNYSFDPAAAGVGIHSITYTFTNANGCTSSASDNVEVFALPIVTYTALSDLCIDAGVQTGQGGGTPTGGIYSGPGITDAGNGTNYSFDPAAAGVGVHTITYTFTNANGCTSSANDNVEVFALPTVTYTALADLCIDAGVQTSVTGGSATGGVYSGPGVTDAGNGTNYSFDPAAAGVGIHTITYTFTNANGCTSSANDNVEVFALPTVTYTALADLCFNAGVQASLTGGLATGGVYSGPGVTDAGNGTNYSFDPAVAGVGIHTITYTASVSGCTSSANDNVEVFALPTVTYTALADLCFDAGVQTSLTGGSATGGVYSGAGVTDDGNGMTYSFDPAAAGVGTHTITYTFTNANGCTNSAADNVEVFALPTVTFTALADLCITDGVQAGLGSGTPLGGVYSGVGVTDDGNGMTYSFDPAAAGVGTQTITYTFTNANGCTNSAADDVEVFAASTGSYTALADLCINAGVQTGLGGGLPTGGVYSGVGITDDGNGMTYSFDPAAAGIGTHTITYTPGGGCSTSADDNVEVFDIPVVTFTAPGDVCPGSTVLTGQGNGLPTGGVYSGTGVTDDANGTTYSFDPSVAGSGTHTITYTFTNANSCSSVASDDIALEDNLAPVSDVVSLPTETATCDVVLTAPTATDGCSGSLTGTTSTVFPVNETTTVVWTFTDASGNSTMQTQDVVIDPVNVGIHVSPDDGQITSLNTDADVDFQWIDCSDNSILDGETLSYYLPTTAGMYALIVTQNGCIDTSECVSSALGMDEFDANTSISIYPNPNNGVFTIELFKETESVKIIDALGKVVYNIKPTSKLINVELSNYEEGIYFVQFEMNNELKTERIVIRK